MSNAITEDIVLDFDNWLGGQPPEIRHGIDAHLKASGANAGRAKKELANMFAVSDETGLDLRTVNDNWSTVRGGYAEKQGGDWLAVKDDEEAFNGRLVQHVTQKRDRRYLLTGKDGTDEESKAIEDRSLQRWAVRAALAGEPPVKAFSEWKANAKTDIKEDFFPMWSQVYGEVAAKVAPHRPALDEAYSALRKGMGMEKEGASALGGVIDAASPLSGMSEQDFRAIGIPALRAMAELAAGSDKGRLMQTMEAFRRPVDNAAGAAFDVLDWFGQNLSAAGGGTESLNQGDLQRTKKTLLRAVADENIDPIKVMSSSTVGKTLEQMMYDTSGSLGYMATAALPGIGIPASMAGYQDSNKAQLMMRNPTMTAADAGAIGAVAAPIQTALDTLSLKMIAGKMPGLSSLINRASAPGANAALRFALYGAGSVGTEYTAEVLQDAAPLAMQATLSAIKSDVPGANWDDLQVLDSRTFFAVLPLALLGAGVNVVKDQKTARALVQDTEALKNFGLSDEQIQSVQSAPDAQSQASALNEAWQSRQPPPDAAERWQEYGGKQEAKQQQAQAQIQELDDAGIAIERNADGWQVTDTANGATVQHATPAEAMQTAKQVLLDRGLRQEDTFLNALGNFAETMREGRTIEVSGKSGNLLQELETAAADGNEGTVSDIWERADEYRAGIGEEALKRDMQDPDSRNALEGLIVLGRSKTEVQNNAARSISLIMQGGGTLDLVEEQAENDLREAVGAGRVSMDTMKAAIEKIEAATGDKYLNTDTKTGITEAWSKIVRLFTTGTRKEGNAITAGSRAETAAQVRSERKRLRKAEVDGVTPGVFAKLREYYAQTRAMLGQVARLMKAHKEGKLTDLEAMIRESVGLKEQDTHDQGVIDEAEQTYTPPTAAQEAEGTAFSVKVYRAGDAEEKGIKPFSSWSRDKRTAEAYLDNPGFGGAELRTESVPEPKNLLVADVRSRSGMRKLAEALGFDSEKGDEWMDNGWQYPWEESAKVRQALEDSDYDAVEYVDDFPEGAKTIIFTKEQEAEGTAFSVRPRDQLNPDKQLGKQPLKVRVAVIKAYRDALGKVPLFSRTVRELQADIDKALGRATQAPATPAAPASTPAILSAYNRLKARAGTESVFISELAKESGLSIPAMHRWITDNVINKGLGNLDEGDWSSSNEEERAAAMTLRDRERLYVSLRPEGFPQTSYAITTADRLERLSEHLGQQARDPAVRFRMFESAKDRLAGMARSVAANDAAYGQTGENMQRRNMLRFLQALDSILAPFPPEVRAKVGGFVKLASLDTDRKMETFLRNRIAKLDGIMEKFLKKEYTAQMDDLMEKSKPQKGGPGEKPVGKLGADTQHLMDSIAAARNLDEVGVMGAVAALDTKIASGLLTPEQETLAERERELINLTGDWSGADASQMAAALKAAQETYDGGWLDWQRKQIEKRERRAAKRENLKVDSGKAGTGPERSQRAEKDMGWKGAVKDFFLSLSSFEEVARYVFGKDSKEAKALVDSERKASYQYTDAVDDMADDIADLFTEMGGSALEGEKIRFRLSQPNIDMRGVNLSEMQAIQAQLMWAQEDGRRHMEGPKNEDGDFVGPWHYDQAWMDELSSKLSPEAARVSAFIRGKYAAEWAALNPYYRERHGVNLPRHDSYAPITVKPIQAKGGEMVDPVTGQAGAGSILTPGSLRTRSKSAIAEPNFRDALQTFIGHTKQMEYWKAYYDLAVEAQAVLGNRELGNSVEAAGGAEAKSVLAKWVDYFAQGGNRDAAAGLALTRGLGKISGRAARMALVGRAGTLLIQSTQLGAGLAEMPSGEFVGRLGKLMSGNLSWGKALDSEFIQRRLKQAPPIVQQAMEGLKSDKPNVVKHAVAHMGSLISGADALFAAGTYAIALDYHMKMGAEAGLNGAELEAYAHNEAERATERVAQPTRPATRSLFENTSTSPLAKLSWAFASEARQKISMAAWAAANGVNDPARLARVAFVTWGVGGLMASVIRSAWRDMRDDDDDELFDEKHWSLPQLVAATIAGPLQGIPGIGDALGTTISKAFGGYAPEGNLFSSLGQAVPAAKDLFSGDFLDDREQVEKLMKDVEAVMTAGGLANETLASLASVAHVVRDAASIADSLHDSPTEHQDKVIRAAVRQQKAAKDDTEQKRVDSLTPEQREAEADQKAKEKEARRKAASDKAARVLGAAE